VTSSRPTAAGCAWPGPPPVRPVRSGPSAPGRARPPLPGCRPATVGGRGAATRPGRVDTTGDVGYRSVLLEGRRIDGFTRDGPAPAAAAWGFLAIGDSARHAHAHAEEGRRHPQVVPGGRRGEGPGTPRRAGGLAPDRKAQDDLPASRRRG